MIPYIIINGVSSRTIHGLLIQSLPPISKPRIKTSIEEIDGRDGDIVTTLGYAAYDKPMTIGLKGDYDIDEIIKYFNSSGRINFSNEIDKYYNFAIYDAIDFNKLLRYRTANVNIHVQPFKYSMHEPHIVWNNPGSATIATIKVKNNGNVASRPLLTIQGKGTITVYINNKQILSIALSNSGETIIIDSADMNATSPSGSYLNRKVTGDYDKLTFPVGINELRVTGDISKITLETYSRWI
jgi:phage-related protein